MRRGFCNIQIFAVGFYDQQDQVPFKSLQIYQSQSSLYLEIA